MALFETLRAHDIDARAAVTGDEIDGVLPRLIARPSGTQHVSAILRSATADGATVATKGAGTKATWGAPASEVDVVIDLSRMDQLVEHQPGDLIATAQAGMPLAAVQESLGSSSQRLALDEMVPGTTVGGLIATNPSGPRRLHVGTVRDLLIGLTMVRADGTIARAGGKVVKNVAGYDICKLMTGSWGTLGVITEATFRLHPVPDATRWLTAHVPDQDLTDLLKSVMHSQLAPSAVEIDCAPDQPTRLAVLLEGTVAGVDTRARVMTALLGHDTGAGDATWTSHYPFKVGGPQIGLKITCSISAVTEIAWKARTLGLQVRGSAGTGVLYAAAPEDVDVTEVASHLQTLRAAVREAGGSVTVLDGPRPTRDALDVWGPVNGLHLMHRIKDEFDPDRRLQPGRFVGGI